MRLKERCEPQLDNATGFDELHRLEKKLWETNTGFGKVFQPLVPVIFRITLLSHLMIVFSRLYVSGHVTEAYRSAERTHEAYTVVLYSRGMLCGNSPVPLQTSQHILNIFVCI